MSTNPKTWIYIDGFNLYYRAVKGTPYKWLDLFALAKRLLPDHNVLGIKYFTARVTGNRDPGSPLRQDVFLRALKHLGNVEVHLGLFAYHDVRRPLAGSNPRKMVLVTDAKEKGSDVNLASHFITDAWLNAYEVGVILSNDSDLETAISLVKAHCKKTIGIINPQRNRMSAELRRLADFKMEIKTSDLAACQLPAAIPGTHLTKPKEW